MDSRRVTLIVTTYNRARQVTTAIDSALAQTHPSVDVVVVDDGSTDGTRAVLAQYEDDPRVRVVRHRANRGVTAAKNSGLDAVPADAAFVGFVDSDDAVFPECVQQLIEPMLANPGAYSQVLGWYGDRAGGEARGVAPVREGIITFEDAICGRLSGDFWHLAQRDAIERYRFDGRASGGESSVWWPMLRDRPGWLRDIVVGAVDSSGSDRVSLRSYSESSARGVMYAYLAVLDAVGEDMRRSCPRRYADVCAEASKWARLAGDGARARLMARRAMRHAWSGRGLALNVMALAPTRLVRGLAAWRARARG